MTLFVSHETQQTVKQVMCINFYTSCGSFVSSLMSVCQKLWQYSLFKKIISQPWAEAYIPTSTLFAAVWKYIPIKSQNGKFLSKAFIMLIGHWRQKFMFDKNSLHEPKYYLHITIPNTNTASCTGIETVTIFLHSRLQMCE